MRIRDTMQWRVRGGSMLFALLALVIVIAPAWGAIYTDVQGEPARRAIERLTAKGIFTAASDSKFNPGGQVTRQELAMYLNRALNLTAEGTLNEFKDAGEVSREAASGVLAMLSLGTVSPQRAEMKKGTLIYRLSTDKGVYTPADKIHLMFTIENTSKDKDVLFEYNNTQFYDFIIRNLNTKEEVARWSLGRTFRPMTEPFRLAKEQKFEFQTLWGQVNQNDHPVPLGRYEVIAVQPTKTNPTTLSIIFTKGLMPGYPDRTWRPKQPATRAETAAVIVHAIGLGEVSASVPLAVSDAAEIPEGARGAVATALEKKIMLPTAQRTFQPARPVTRAEIAWALDALMDLGKRYDFSKGFLKDIAVGTPTLVVIEDERKSSRAYRLARAYAVYRNDKLVDLKDLRPGDTVLLLKLGDVGDVAYIEATGK